ncbi:uncharacterized protein LOC144937884 isoform X4 [Lampetra fluviatilis]
MGWTSRWRGRSATAPQRPRRAAIWGTRSNSSGALRRPSCAASITWTSRGRSATRLAKRGPCTSWAACTTRRARAGAVLRARTPGSWALKPSSAWSKQSTTTKPTWHWCGSSETGRLKAEPSVTWATPITSWAASAKPWPATRSGWLSHGSLETRGRRGVRTATWEMRTSSSASSSPPRSFTSRKTLQLARQLRERAVEAQACYSLGNTCTLMQDYCRAVEFHLKHLAIAQELQDRVGEARACFSLGNAHSALGSNREAVRFVTKHLELSREIGDRSGEATARANLEELHGILAINNNNNDDHNGTKRPNELPIRGNEFTTQGARPRIIHRHSVDNMELMKLTIDKSQNGGDEARSPGQGRPPLVKQLSGCSFLPSRLKGRKYREGITTAERRSTAAAAAAAAAADTDDVTVQLPNMRISPEPSSDSEGFFEQLSRSQADRMDDQRCSFLSPGDTASSLTVSANRNSRLPSPQTEELLDLIMQTQGRRLDDQRATGSDLPGLNVAQCGGAAATGGGLGQLLANGEVPQPDDDFFDMLVRCQGSRLDDQRCAPPPEAPRGPTVPDEDFLSLIQRTQAKRLDEQRVSLPPGLRRPNTS